MTNTIEKNYTISLIRSIATFMIILCHILQNIGNELAWWLNVGVQIFFVMSGFLYGAKVIDDPSKWIFKRFYKILLDYYIFVFVMSIIYSITGAYDVNLLRLGINILGLQGFVSGIPNVQHLWFITYILICYLITPLLQNIITVLNKKSELIFWVCILLFILGLQILDIVKAINITVPWIACYIFGYAISNRYIRNESYNDKLTLKSITILTIPLCILLNLVEIYSKYIAKIKLESGITSSLLNLIYKYAHASLGITLFLCMFLVFNKYCKKYHSKYFINALNYSDEYSYDVYIVHQIFILGSFSFIGRTSYLWLDILLVFFLIIASSLVLRKVSCIINNLISIILAKRSNNIKSTH